AMYVPIGSHAGPFWSRKFRHSAVIHTCDPAATVGANSRSKLVRVVPPWKSQSFRSAGGVAPTCVKIYAPATPSGLPRRSELTLRSFSFTVRPPTEATSITGDVVGGLIGEGLTSRGFSPRSIFCSGVTLAVACTIFAQVRAFAFSA